MAGLLDGVDQRTNLVGENRLELLMFRLGGRQRYGINVFKIHEVIQCPPLNRMVHSNPMVCGITHLRGRTIPVIDLAKAIGKRGVDKCEDAFVIVTEYNRSIQGFLVSNVERIINLNWEEIKAPPSGLGKNSYMTAVTHVEDDMVEIIDVEKVLADLVGTLAELDKPEQYRGGSQQPVRILVVDDSSVARNQITRTLEQMGMQPIVGKNGREGLQLLKDMLGSGQLVDAVISDVEMPEMDGYTLTQEIRQNEQLRQLPVLLHTSLSGVFNNAMIKKVGADKFVPKFQADELAKEVVNLLQEKQIL
ncbi:chemotaxis protein [Thiohalophilus sp.]|uniref:chemotaxis protein n=1 Tax=Thiohalophilus sp. TaxID=3028392 RepID=UPI002ACE4552|nr:chemotaxis protein [Thiohalophilus sp.]MDZ7802612.1 chemotaxis protein [Thiohalophilus sp.]